MKVFPGMTGIKISELSGEDHPQTRGAPSKRAGNWMERKDCVGSSLTRMLSSS